MSTATIIVLVVAVVAIGIALMMFMQKRRTQTLRSKFGPEYDRTVEQERGNARRAEAILDERQKRVEKFHVRPLSQEECDRFATQWRAAQERFVDDPRAAVSDADALVHQAMKGRGYPMGDFEQQAADISVEHPQVVENYRAAHSIAERDKRGEASTEDLRHAMQHYRDLFENLLDRRMASNRGEKVYEEVHS